MEPLSIVVISAAVGGAAAKFVEKAWDSGEKWMQTFFKDHREVAQQKATQNIMDFLNVLSQRVKRIEDSNQIPKEDIDSAQDHPDFSALLQKALLTSAQTDNKDKHAILARIVSERLKSEPESILALGSKMACDSISYATIDQLLILGLAVNLYNIRPSPFPPDGIQEDHFQAWLDNWLTIRLEPYRGIKFRPIDITHLESLSCVKANSFVTRQLDSIYGRERYKFAFKKLKDIDLRESVTKIWNDGMQKIDLTTVGQIIGVSVSDLLTGGDTTFEGWE